MSILSILSLFSYLRRFYRKQVIVKEINFFLLQNKNSVLIYFKLIQTGCTHHRRLLHNVRAAERKRSKKSRTLKTGGERDPCPGHELRGPRQSLGRHPRVSPRTNPNENAISKDGLLSSPASPGSHHRIPGCAGDGFCLHSTIV